MKEFGNRFMIYAVQALYICKDENCNLAEATISVLASSYSDEMGVNGKHAGGIGENKNWGKARGFAVNVNHLFPPPDKVRRAFDRAEKDMEIKTTKQLQWNKSVNDHPDLEIYRQEMEDEFQEFEEYHTELGARAKAMKFAKDEQQLTKLFEVTMTGSADDLSEEEDSPVEVRPRERPEVEDVGIEEDSENGETFEEEQLFEEYYGDH